MDDKVERVVKMIQKRISQVSVEDIKMNIFSVYTVTLEKEEEDYCSVYTVSQVYKSSSQCTV